MLLHQCLRVAMLILLLSTESFRTASVQQLLLAFFVDPSVGQSDQSESGLVP
jgi:hypothetical protein